MLTSDQAVRPTLPMPVQSLDASCSMPFQAVPAADNIQLKGADNTPAAPRPSAVSPFQAFDAAVPTVRQTADAASERLSALATGARDLLAAVS